jgi:DNA-binding beta-propeller fold protein YncE
MRHRCSRWLAGLVGVVALGALAPPAMAAGAAPLRDALLVGNNWDGTADLIDVPSYKRLDHIDIVPDLAARKAEILLNPVDAFWFTLIQQAVGEGHDQLVDDMFASGDGRQIFVSRPSLADVVAIDLATHKIVWRTKVEGNRADHMAISPDRKRLLVSASTANVVDVIDTATGKIVANFPSGDSPHENNFSRDGKLVYHASIGRVYVPTNDPVSDAAKGKRFFEIVDAHSWKVVRTFDIAQKLTEFGRPGMSPAIRPMALSPDERFVYLQLSFLHGFVEYDLQLDKVTRVLDMPAMSDQYVLNSAHHGLQMNPEGTKLCVAGTIDNYVAIVHRESFKYKIIPVGNRPYWASNSDDGKYCYVSIAGDDRIAVISYAEERQVATIPVGDHPQRNRTAQVSTAIYGGVPGGVAVTLPVSVQRRSVASAARNSTLRLGLVSTAKVTGLVGRLHRAGRTVGSGKLGSLNGRGTLKLWLRRALRSGAYKLTLSGVVGSGPRARKTFAIRVR